MDRLPLTILTENHQEYGQGTTLDMDRLPLRVWTDHHSDCGQTNIQDMDRQPLWTVNHQVGCQATMLKKIGFPSPPPHPQKG